MRIFIQAFPAELSLMMFYVLFLPSLHQHFSWALASGLPEVLLETKTHGSHSNSTNYHLWGWGETVHVEGENHFTRV